MHWHNSASRQRSILILDPDIQRLDAVSKPFTDEKRAEVISSSLYKTFTQKNQAHFIEPTRQSDLTHWKDATADEETENRKEENIPYSTFNTQFSGTVFSNQYSSSQHSERYSADAITQHIYYRFNQSRFYFNSSAGCA